MRQVNAIHCKIDINNATTNAQISVQLADDCKNGHADFSVTATFWQPGKQRIDRNYIMGGCCHEENLRVRKSLAPIIALHLCDFSGAPMYTAGNGLYHAKPGKYHNPKAGPVELSRYFRIPLELAVKLAIAEDEFHMRWLIEQYKVDEIWQNEANAAVKQIEGLYETLYGEKVQFVSAHTKRNYKRLEGEERDVLLERLNSGYYTETAVLERAAQKEAARIEEKEAGLLKRLNGDTEKAKTAYLVDTTIGRLFAYRKDNYIYYDHDSTLDFNWRDYGQNVLFTKEEILAAFDAVRAAGVVCELGKRALAEVNKH